MKRYGKDNAIQVTWGKENEAVGSVTENRNQAEHHKWTISRLCKKDSILAVRENM